MPSEITVGLLSPEPWDKVWRRNQHLVNELVKQRLVGRVVFVGPSRPAVAWRRSRVNPRIDVVVPGALVPKRLGGLRLLGWQLRRGALRGIDVLWVNDATLGHHCLGEGLPAIYDVTDDWRCVDAPKYIRRRLVTAEEYLSTRTRTVVCSEVLRERWHERYGVDALVVKNGIDSDAWTGVSPRPLSGRAPHVGYVGTLHEQRLDVDLVLALASRDEIGTVHLSGPSALGAEATAKLRHCPKVMLDGPVPASDVPSLTASFDVLISPHVVSPFTLSLDAIKSYEYLASGRPIVATPTSGFQLLHSQRLTTVDRRAFTSEVIRLLGTPRATVSNHEVGSWADRAREFAEALHSVM